MRAALPAAIAGYGAVRPFAAPPENAPADRKARDKRVPDLDAAIAASGLRDGGTVSFHHHLRDGDAVLNLVMRALAARGLRDLRVAASSIFPVHAPLAEHMREGVVTGLHTAYMRGPAADAVTRGVLARPAVMTTHGGRPRAIAAGTLPIDVAFIAAPAADMCGNVCGTAGHAACGPLGYAVADAEHAAHVVVVTDTLLPYPAAPIDIPQHRVDSVVVVQSIGDPSRIASGTVRPASDPVRLAIAAAAADVIAASGLLVDGFAFQAGAGAVSLAVAAALAERMRARGVQGGFAAGGITGSLVAMLQAGLFRTLLDVQCFDLAAVESYRTDPRHRAMSAALYASPGPRGAVVDRLDAMILGAAEVDFGFNVNVTTGTDGTIIGGSGGHADTAAGARLALVTTTLTAGAGAPGGPFAKIVERVRTVTTPGATIDAVVTEAGIAINPRRPELRDRLLEAGLTVVPIEDLAGMAARAGGAAPPAADDTGRVAAVVEYRDGSVIDVIRVPG